jgi:hypothetical protein
MTDNIILGSGIAGLIYGFYNKDYKILGNKSGGQMASKFPLGARYLYKTKFTEQFLKSLYISALEKIIKVGYVENSRFINNPDREFRKKYFMKSRGLSSFDELDETVMNCQRQQLNIYDVDFKEIINKLQDVIGARNITAEILSVDLKNKNISTDTGTFNFNNLVSTIPLNIFCKLAGVKPQEELKTQDVTYVLLNNNFFDMSNYDMVYCIGQEKYHRLTATNKGIVADCLYACFNHELNKYFNGFVQDSCVVKNAQIVGLKKQIEIPGVKLFGRYGAYNRNYRTDTLIEEMLKC